MTARLVKDRDAADTFQAGRVIAGKCPTCNRVVVIFNNYGVWPYVECVCGWAGATTEIRHHVRLERDFLNAEQDAAPAPEVDR